MPHLAYRESHAERLRQLLRGSALVCERSMFGYPAFCANRRMFACVYGDGVGIKLPAERVSELLKRPDAAPFRPHGKPVMREWVMLTREDSDAYADDLPILLEAVAYTAIKVAPKVGSDKRKARRVG